MCLRRHSLRSHGESDGDVQLPLPRLPTHYRQRIHARCLCAREGIQNHERIPALLFYAEPHGRSQQARILSRMRFATFRWSKRDGPGHRRFQLGRPEFVQTGATHVGLGRTALGSDRSEAAKVRKISAVLNPARAHARPRDGKSRLYPRDRW